MENQIRSEAPAVLELPTALRGAELMFKIISSLRLP
jgi:hypothetical protein